MPLKYLGSKQKLLPHITAAVEALGVTSVLDLFAGSTRVGQSLKKAGVFVVSNDIASYSRALGLTYITANRDYVDIPKVESWIDRLNDDRLVRDGYVTQTFSREARYFQEHNARKIDGILHAIRHVDDSWLQECLRSSLILAADRVDSTCGQFQAYLKQWSPRSYNPLVMKVPEFLPGPGLTTQLDALEHTEGLSLLTEATYIDSPYNQHRYDANYHVWETLVRDDAPEAYGVARKRGDIKQTSNPFNRKTQCMDALRRVVEQIQSPYIILSFSDEGFVTKEWLRGLMMKHRHHTAVMGIPSNRYIGARIGISNNKGEKVGTVSHTTNTEFLFLGGPDREKVLAAHDACQQVVSKTV